MKRLLGFFLLAGVAGAANEDCVACHPKQGKAHAPTSMARALEPASRGSILRAHEKLTFEQGPYRYTIERKGDASVYTVSDGKDEMRVPVAWAFGLGAAGQTYVLNNAGKWYESRVSYYKDTDALDLTVGARPDVPRSLEEALGRELSGRGAAECFNCHATGALPQGELRVDLLTPGIQCARCHTKAAAHAASMTGKETPKVVPARLGKLAAEETSEFCGQCHRTWSQIATNGPHNVANVRFQPYRLTNSKCFDTTDARIRCTACHDPHEDAVHQIGFYDSRCGACHSAKSAKAGAKLCKVGKANCASCHMPKVELKEAHNAFTDHWIRVARPNAPYPN